MKFSTLIFALLFMACEKSNQPMTQNPPPAEMTSISYLALGDSYTIGESVEVSGRYPVQLAEKLQAEGMIVQNPQIIAKTGWRTDQLISAVEDANLQDTFDLVSLLIGVNNQFQGKSIDVYETEFSELLQRAIQLAGGNKDRVFVVSIPDYAFTAYGQSTSNPNNISEGVDQFNLVNRQITQAAEVRYFNITPISRRGVDEPELVASDGLHPSTEQYRQWVASFLEEVKEMLK